jgi:hypothetical protein
VKFIENVESVPLATKIVPTMPAEASVDPVEEPGSKKTEEQPKLLSPPTVTELSKLLATTTTTPRKRRMAMFWILFWNP